MSITDLESPSFPVRMRSAVSFAWSLFSRKVGGNLIPVNKEASMQLQFAYLLQQILPLITFHADEKLTLELETGVRVGSSTREVDIMLTGIAGVTRHKLAIELKCYRKITATGGNRGATDIFMKDVYHDLQLLEQYVECSHADEGVMLVMSDLNQFVTPKSKTKKCWTYDISDGARFGPVFLNTPIGGKPVSIVLKKNYRFEWLHYGDFWFLEAQGT